MGKKFKKRWRVEVCYYGYDRWFDDRIEAKARRESDGSGCGFGIRDMSFSFATKKAAYRAAKTIRTLRTKNNVLTARVDLCEDYN